jgi:hypothetical protein
MTSGKLEIGDGEAALVVDTFHSSAREPGAYDQKQYKFKLGDAAFGARKRT